MFLIIALAVFEYAVGRAYKRAMGSTRPAVQYIVQEREPIGYELVKQTEAAAKSKGFDVRAIAEGAGFDIPMGVYDLPSEYEWEEFENLDKGEWLRGA